MTPHDFGVFIGKQAANTGLPGTYSGGIRTQDAQGNAMPLNPAQQQRVNQVGKIRAMNRGEMPVGPVNTAGPAAQTPAASRPAPAMPAMPAATPKPNTSVVRKSRSAF